MSDSSNKYYRLLCVLARKIGIKIPFTYQGTYITDCSTSECGRFSAGVFYYLTDHSSERLTWGFFQ